jgi:glycosyltransferase involved in cell wall biosynthesis
MGARIAGIARSSGAGMFLHSPVAHESVPAWIAHCDACAVPYRLNDFTRASSPLKAIEYLGAGAPVLSTEVPSLSAFGNAIAWVRQGDGASYAAALDAVAAEGRSAGAVERRRAAVRAESWGNKVQRFRDLLKK